MVYRIIFFLIAVSASSYAQKTEILRFNGPSLNENAYFVNSQKSSFLIDALSTKNAATEMLNTLKTDAKAPQFVFITHGHPDHFTGLPTIIEAFPKIKIFVADERIKNDIIGFVNYATKAGLFKDNKEIQPYSSSNTNGFDYNRIQVYSSKKIPLTKSSFLNVDVIKSPSEANTITILKSEDGKTIFTSDLVYNDTFHWLGPGVNHEALTTWKMLLQELSEEISANAIVYPGHGELGSKILITNSANYLSVFETVVSNAKNEESASNLLRAIFKDWRGEFLLKRSLDNWMNEKVTSPPKFENIVDLTHTLNEAFPFIPVPGITFPFKMEAIATIDEMGVGANQWKIHEHLGTQIDAPNHFIKNGKGLDKLLAKDLIVPVIVIDISEKASANRDAELTVQDIKKWEGKYGKILDGACIMMYSGWEQFLHDEKFIGLDAKGVKHFPGISLEAAKFLTDERNIWGVGVDVISFDPGYDHEYKTHKWLLGANKWALECVANLDKIPATGALLFVGAPKVENATGGLTRIIAVW